VLVQAALNSSELEKGV